ncbi:MULTISPECIES: hypothetical protein [unclassified Acinetobacter]|jgi:hypothetical protein|uniref:hypothetical protein n=1 Tax=Acinetobacter TaxID=469 RepID=UPI0018AC16C4|nr:MULTISPECIES: hypothetical protein [unclassified Acinetobacter]MBJ9954299.1 hypothetical protein [Acinetobacter baumannii]
METKQFNKISIVLNFILLILTCMALIYTLKQTRIAQEQANIAKDQTKIMVQQTDIAKYSLNAAQKSYELAEKVYRDSLNKDFYDNSFAVVVDQEMQQGLFTSVYNGKTINVKFENKSSRPQSYLVTVEAQGIMVSHPHSNYMYPIIQLTEHPVALDKSEVYQAQFVAFIPKHIKKDATIVVKANGKIIRSAQYKYANDSNSYEVIKSSRY